jgi:CRISPR-associated endonuclease Csn1
LNIVIERLKNGDIPVPEKYTDKNGCEYTLLFHLSPNDLVYVPNDEDIENSVNLDFTNFKKDQLSKLYKMVSSSAYQCFFVQNNVATTIANKLEFSALNKTERSIDGIMIKDRCWKLEIDRLGRVLNVQS